MHFKEGRIKNYIGSILFLSLAFLSKAASACLTTAALDKSPVSFAKQYVNALDLAHTSHVRLVEIPENASVEAILFNIKASIKDNVCSIRSMDDFRESKEEAERGAVLGLTLALEQRNRILEAMQNGIIEVLNGQKSKKAGTEANEKAERMLENKESSKTLLMATGLVSHALVGFKDEKPILKMTKKQKKYLTQDLNKITRGSKKEDKSPAATCAKLLIDFLSKDWKTSD